MRHRQFYLLLLTILLTACAHKPLQVNSGNQADILIAQGGNAAVTDAGGVLRLRGESFEIRSRWSRVNVCVSKSKADLGKVAAGVDTVREMGSCFNLGKSYAMEGDADYLVLGDGVNALNEAHGMRRNDRNYWFPVRSFYDEKSRKDLPLAKAKGRYYAAFWVDKSGDLKLDAGEFALVQLLLE